MTPQAYAAAAAAAATATAATATTSSVSVADEADLDSSDEDGASRWHRSSGDGARRLWVEQLYRFEEQA